MVCTAAPIFPSFGVELRGFDLNDPSSSQTVREAFDNHHFVLIRDIDLDEKQQLALTEAVGPVAPGVLQQGAPNPEAKFSYVSNQRKDGILRDGELMFHSDTMFHEWPLKALTLYCIDAPNVGGETAFSNSATAYQRLPATLKQRIANLKGRHIVSYGAAMGARRPKFDLSMKTAIHPLVWRHPENGKELLFASRLLTEGVVGLDDAESGALLEELFAYIEDPAHIYEHKWRVGDYILWDNRHLQHSRRYFEPTEKRTLRRMSIREPLETAMVA